MSADWRWLHDHPSCAWCHNWVWDVKRAPNGKFYCEDCRNQPNKLRRRTRWPEDAEPNADIHRVTGNITRFVGLFDDGWHFFVMLDSPHYGQMLPHNWPTFPTRKAAVTFADAWRLGDRQHLREATP